jgi:hypothetical protein
MKVRSRMSATLLPRLFASEALMKNGIKNPTESTSIKNVSVLPRPNIEKPP